MNKIIIIIVIIILALLGIFWFMGQNPDVEESVENQEEMMEEETMQEEEMNETSGEQMQAEAEVKEFNFEGTEFAFNLDEIRVNQGDTVRINFSNAGTMPHDFVIDEFNTRTAVLNPGQKETIEFKASQTGEFEYYCSVGSHRAQGMFGTLIVE